MDTQTITAALLPHTTGYRLVVDEQRHGATFKASLIDGELCVSGQFPLAAIDEPELLKACADTLIKAVSYYRTEEQ